MEVIKKKKIHQNTAKINLSLQTLSKHDIIEPAKINQSNLHLTKFDKISNKKLCKMKQ
jgi:hypothetical protein